MTDEVIIKEAVRLVADGVSVTFPVKGRSMLPFIIESGELPFKNLDYIFIPNIKKAIQNKQKEIKAYVVKDSLEEFTLKMGDLTDDERTIILDGCLINYYAK